MLTFIADCLDAPKFNFFQRDPPRNPSRKTATIPREYSAQNIVSTSISFILHPHKSMKKFYEDIPPHHTEEKPRNTA